MQRWHVMAFGLILATVGPMGCAVKSSPADGAQTPQAFAQASAFLTAVDVDVLEDHTLITLQSDAPLRYTVRRDDAPPRLIVDLPGHKIAPGVRVLEVFRGGVTVITPREDVDHGVSQVQIGLGPAVTHSWSSPFASTVLVEIRPESPAQNASPAGEDGRRQGRTPGDSPLGRASHPVKNQQLLTLERFLNQCKA
jgi:hypothetical protein